VLEMVTLDGTQCEDVISGVVGVNEFGCYKPLTAEALLPTPLVFELFEDGACLRGVHLHLVEARRAEPPRGTLPQEVRPGVAASGRGPEQNRMEATALGDARRFLRSGGVGVRRYWAVRCRTCGSVPRPFYSALSKEFIDPQFQIRWWDEDRGKAGSIVYQMSFQLEDLEYGSVSPEYEVIRDHVTVLQEGYSKRMHFPPDLLNF